MNRRGHKGRVDGTHAQIMAALRKAGIAVRSLAQVGDGVPDLLVGVRDQTFLLELKVPGAKLRASQEAFIATWPGRVLVADSAEAAIRAVYEAARPRYAPPEGWDANGSPA